MRSRCRIAACALAALASTAGAAAASSPPAGNGDIAFSRYPSDDATRQIYVVGPNGHHRRRLTSGPADNYSPAYSPDGERIAFTRARQAGDRTAYSIFVMNDDGDHKRRLASGWDPRFRPDGRRIVFSRGRAVYVMDADGSDVRLLAPGGTSPDYSPDGRRIVFEGRGRGDPGIFVMHADGSHVRRLTRSPAVPPNPVDTYPGYLYYDWGPRFSPDGRRIVFLRQQGWDAAGYGDVFAMDANGANARDLTPPDPHWHAYSDPTFSADGRRIAFGGYGGLYVMRTDGAHRRVVTAAGDDAGPDWQPRDAD